MDLRSTSLPSSHYTPR